MEMTFTGPCRWAKVFEPDMKFGPRYSIEVQLSDEDYEDYRKAGCQGELSKDGEGYITFRRPESLLSRKGRLMKYGKPIVVDADGKPFEKSIGNGSVVTVKIVTFETERGVGTRLEGVKVLEHVEFNEPDTQKNGDMVFDPRPF